LTPSPDVLHFKLDASGFLAAFPYLLMAGIVQSAGILADYARTKGRLTTTFVSGRIVTHGANPSTSEFTTTTTTRLERCSQSRRQYFCVENLEATYGEVYFTVIVALDQVYKKNDFLGLVFFVNGIKQKK
jgi:hypothetical protein